MLCNTFSILLLQIYAEKMEDKREKFSPGGIQEETKDLPSLKVVNLFFGEHHSKSKFVGLI